MMDAEQVTQLRIASGSNIQNCVARVLQTLEALPAQAVVRLIAQGNAVAKAVTIAEISRRRLRRLHQNTQVGLVRNAGTESSSAANTSIDASKSEPVPMPRNRGISRRSQRMSCFPDGSLTTTRQRMLSRGPPIGRSDRGLTSDRVVMQR